MNFLHEQSEELLRIVGAEDFSDDGFEGQVTVQGPLGDEIMKSLVPAHFSSFEGKPVRVSRCGGLEIWCEGWYMEGRGVRRVVHASVRAVLANT